MSEPGWFTPEMASAEGLKRVHNGIGWFWAKPGTPWHDAFREETARCRAVGDVPPEELGLQRRCGCGRHYFATNGDCCEDCR